MNIKALCLGVTHLCRLDAAQTNNKQALQICMIWFQLHSGRNWYFKNDNNQVNVVT